MSTVDLVFPVSGESLPTDHAYLLYSALSHAIRDFHVEDGGIRFSPINGERAGPSLNRLFALARALAMAHGVGYLVRVRR
jgi:hypothetical protein